MNKVALIQTVSENTGLSRADATKAIDETFSSILAALVRGEDVRIPSFGIFEVVLRKARYVRVPKTGERIWASESKQLRFRAGSVVKECLNR